VSDRPAGRPVPAISCASARKRANVRNGTNDETSTERHTSAQQLRQRQFETLRLSAQVDAHVMVPGVEGRLPRS
jgi:hypothetical protein